MDRMQGKYFLLTAVFVDVDSQILRQLSEIIVIVFCQVFHTLIHRSSLLLSLLFTPTDMHLNVAGSILEEHFADLLE